MESRFSHTDLRYLPDFIPTIHQCNTRFGLLAATLSVSTALPFFLLSCSLSW